MRLAARRGLVVMLLVDGLIVLFAVVLPNGRVKAVLAILALVVNAAAVLAAVNAGDRSGLQTPRSFQADRGDLPGRQ